jgi:threonine dehydrogenase-like Zn-dependent dehydrogenase
MLADMVPTGFHGVELADIQFGDTVAVIGIGPVGLMAVAGAAIRGASTIYAVGSRQNCCDLALEFGATDIINYKNGDIVEQIMTKTNGKGVDKIVIAGGDNSTMAQALTMLKPGGIIGNVNYLGEGDYVPVPRVEWGCGMGHKQIRGGLMPGGRLRLEKLASLVMAGRIHPEKLITHRFTGLESVETALMLMKDKPRDLIKPLVLIED